jgi:hypothetical protein
MVELSQQLGALVAKFRAETDSVTKEFRQALSLEDIEAAAAAQTEDVEQPSASEAVATAIPGPDPQAPAVVSPGAAAGGAERQAPFVEREVRVTADGASPAPVVLADSDAIEIQVGEFVTREEEAESLELEQAVLVMEEETPVEDAQGAVVANDDATDSKG